jgi:hypothetical protein
VVQDLDRGVRIADRGSELFGRGYSLAGLTFSKPKYLPSAGKRSVYCSRTVLFSAFFDGFGAFNTM